MLGLGGYFWRKWIAIYLDGKVFQYKTKSMDIARVPKQGSGEKM